MKTISHCGLPVLIVACGAALALALAHDACQAIAVGGRQLPVVSKNEESDPQMTQIDRRLPESASSAKSADESPAIASRKGLRSQVQQRIARQATADMAEPAKAALGSIAHFFDTAAKAVGSAKKKSDPQMTQIAQNENQSASSAKSADKQTSEPVKTAAPAKLPEAPKVAIDGPTAGTPGCMPVFTAKVSGRYDAMKWAVTPSCEGLLILADPRQCTFGNDEPGEYTIRCTVSGGRQIAECEIVYEIVDSNPMPADPVGRAVPAAGAGAGAHRAPYQPPTAPQLTLPEQILEQINKIQTGARAAEAKALGACFRDAANRFDTGQTPPGTDIAVEIFRCAKAGLGDATVPKWKPFFEWTALRLAILQQAGLSPSGFLNQVALVMGQVQ